MTNMQVFQAVADGRMTPEEGAEYLMMLREKKNAEMWRAAAHVCQAGAALLLVASAIYGLIQ